MDDRVLGNNKGSTFILMMLIIALMGIGLLGIAKQWKMVLKREKESELLARGMEIQSAILAYSTSIRKARITTTGYFPASLNDLVNPPSPMKPFLRKLYNDPITGGEWDYFRDSYGHIMGVKSRSTDEAIKRYNFPLAVQHFEGQIRYKEWIFMTVSAAPTTQGTMVMPRPAPPIRR